MTAVLIFSCGSVAFAYEDDRRINPYYEEEPEKETILGKIWAFIKKMILLPKTILTKLTGKK